MFIELVNHSTISFSVTPFSCPQSFPASRSFPNELVLHIRWSNYWNFPGGSDGKASAYNAGYLGSIPRLGRSSGEGNGNSLQYSCLENPTDGRAWWATVHGVTKSRTRLSDFTHSHASKAKLKILQARLQQHVNRELPYVQDGFRKGRGPRDQIANIRWIMEKGREFQKTSISALLTMPKPLTVWITINCGKF